MYLLGEVDQRLQLTALQAAHLGTEVKSQPCSRASCRVQGHLRWARSLAPVEASSEECTLKAREASQPRRLRSRATRWGSFCGRIPRESPGAKRIPLPWRPNSMCSTCGKHDCSQGVAVQVFIVDGCMPGRFAPEVQNKWAGWWRNRMVHNRADVHGARACIKLHESADGHAIPRKGGWSSGCSMHHAKPSKAGCTGESEGTLLTRCSASTLGYASTLYMIEQQQQAQRHVTGPETEGHLHTD